MRRTISLSVATVLAVLGLVVGIAIGQPIISHGGTPSDVFMKTQPFPEACMEGINPDSVTDFPLQIEVATTSHVLAYFTFEVFGLERGEFAGLNVVLDGVAPRDEYDFVAQDEPSARINPSGTVMWTFPNVAAGTHTVAVFAVLNQTGRIGNPDLIAGLENCSLTAFVVPVAA